jgi:hypothetical protein
LSFFDDGEETAPRPVSRAQRPRPAGTPGARRPRPRRPQPSGRRAAAPDQHTLMVRRLVAAGGAVVALIVIALVVNAIVKSDKVQSLKEYNSQVSQIAQEWDSEITHPLFSTLTDAAGKSASEVEDQVNQLRLQAQSLAAHAKGLSVPGEMAAAQRDLLLALDMRVEAMTKLASLIPVALGGQAQQSASQIAGAMEILLASDVVYSQRVAPLIQQTLAANGVQGVSTTATHSLSNVGWLESSTVQSRIAGQPASSSSAPVTGNHGSALKGVSVGTNNLEGESALNHISGGGNPTFTVQVENSGEFAETNVKVDVTVTAGGKQYKASHAIDKTEPGKTVDVEIPVSGIPLGVAAKIEVFIEPVPGENDVENNKGTYLAIFGQ